MERIRTFEDLECYRKCRELRLKVRVLVRKFEDSEKYRLVDQMIRCSRSVTNNIAEGYGRFHYKENAQFCRQSRGSLYELLDHLGIALDDGLVGDSEYAELRENTMTCIRLLNGYINYLVSSTEEKNRN